MPKKRLSHRYDLHSDSSFFSVAEKCGQIYRYCATSHIQLHKFSTVSRRSPPSARLSVLALRRGMGFLWSGVAFLWSFPELSIFFLRSLFKPHLMTTRAIDVGKNMTISKTFHTGAVYSLIAFNHLGSNPLKFS